MFERQPPRSMLEHSAALAQVERTVGSALVLHAGRALATLRLTRLVASAKSARSMYQLQKKRL